MDSELRPRLGTAFGLAVEWGVALLVAAGWVFGAWVAFLAVLSLPRLPAAGWALVPLALAGPAAGFVHRSWRVAGLSIALTAMSFAGFWALWQRPMFWGL